MNKFRKKTVLPVTSKYDSSKFSLKIHSTQAESNYKSELTFIPSLDRAGLRLSQALGNFLIFAEQNFFGGSIPFILTFVGHFYVIFFPLYAPFLSFFALVGPFIFVGPRHFAQSALWSAGPQSRRHIFLYSSMVIVLNTYLSPL